MLPSQLQRRGIFYAESKTEGQPTKHCKLYSSEISDRPRDRKASWTMPASTAATDIETRYYDPGHLSSRTPSFARSKHRQRSNTG